MGIDKKIGIEKEARVLADKYATRFCLTDHFLSISRKSGNRVMYFTGTDSDGITYRVRFVWLKKMRRPIGFQVVNRHFYLVHQAEIVHGIDKYDYSLIKESDITFANKLDIICKVHGVFKKRKSAHVTDREGCPKCSANKMRELRKF